MLGEALSRSSEGLGCSRYLRKAALFDFTLVDPSSDENGSKTSANGTISHHLATLVQNRTPCKVQYLLSAQWQYAKYMRGVGKLVFRWRTDLLYTWTVSVSKDDQITPFAFVTR